MKVLGCVIAQWYLCLLFFFIEAMREYSSKKIHLFFSGPYPITLFLGWLWNAGPSLKIYEFDKSIGQYLDNPYQPKLN